MFKLDVDTAEMLHDAATNLDELEHETDQAAWSAGDEGIKSEQEDHPYTDRTYNLSASAHVEAADDGGPGVDMVWPADYASYVNDGTERSKPYPFIPIAEKRAERVLHYDLANASDAFCDKFS